MRINEDDYCIMQPTNIGIVCPEHDKCERCGWNPEYLEKLRKAKERNKKAGKE